MRLSIHSKITFRCEEPSDFLLQFEAAANDQQLVLNAETNLSPDVIFSRVSAQDSVGERLWLRSSGTVHASYRAKLSITRDNHDLGSLVAVDPANLSAEAVSYLFDTRYCLTEKFAPFVNEEFGELSGGARILAMRDWIAQHFSYDPAASTAETTAIDSFMDRRGVCRDYAHVLISMARASGIPARYVACYAPDVRPQDFHAVAELYLADPETEVSNWYLVDATGMTEPSSTAIIGVGRDAADVSFFTCFGSSEFLSCSVEVARDE